MLQMTITNAGAHIEFMVPWKKAHLKEAAYVCENWLKEIFTRLEAFLHTAVSSTNVMHNVTWH